MFKPQDDGQRHRQAYQRQVREDLAEQYRYMAQEMNALRTQYRGTPEADVRTMLSVRFGTELDEHRLDACARAISANEVVVLTLDPLPRQQQQRSRPRPRRD